MAEVLRTPEQAKEAAHRIVEQAQGKENKRKLDLERVIGEISKVTTQDGGFEEVAVLLSLPDEDFQLLAPVFLAELEKNYHNINDQLSMVQAMNLAGLHAEDAKNEFINIAKTIDEQFEDILTYPKRDFLKQMLAMTYNALAEAEGVTKRNILIPIE